MHDPVFIKNKAFAFAILILIIGGINVSYSAFYKTDLVTQVVGKKSILPTLLYILMGISALCIGFSRDTYLPFLGPSVIPCSVLSPIVPDDADFEVNIQTNPGNKVLYWASEPKNDDLHKINDWKQAYLQYKNAGVAIANEQGVAILQVRKPQSYTLPIKGELQPHIHYRICRDDGFIGRVETVEVDTREYFSNYVSSQESQEQLTSPPPAPTFVVETTNDAISYLNQIATDTLKNSKMVESGAYNADMKHSGWDIDEAYNGKLH